MRSANDEYLTSRFGRVVHAQADIGPYIGRNGVRVEEVLGLVDEGFNYKEVCDQIPGLAIKDVMACMAYRERFLRDTLKQAYPDAEKAFVLDENISYLLLPKVSELFGQSTSVLAEGLYFQRNDDEGDVWRFTVENGFKAILTQDSDFKGIIRRHHLKRAFDCAAAPKVMMIPHGLGIKQIGRLLQKHRQAIEDVIEPGSDGSIFRVGDSGVRDISVSRRVLQAA